MKRNIENIKKDLGTEKENYIEDNNQYCNCVPMALLLSNRLIKSSVDGYHLRFDILNINVGHLVFPKIRFCLFCGRPLKVIKCRYAKECSSYRQFSDLCNKDQNGCNHYKIFSKEVIKNNQKYAFTQIKE